MPTFDHLIQQLTVIVVMGEAWVDMSPLTVGFM
jgi:hypothetical protein